MPNGEATESDPETVLSRAHVRALPRLLTCVTRLLCGFSALTALILPLPVLYEVVMDQLGHPPIWVFEATGYGILMIAFAASGYGLNTGHHFRVTLLSERIPALTLPLALLSGALEATFGLILLIAGWRLAYGSWLEGLRSDTLLAVPQVWPQLALPIGGAAILLQGIAHMLAPPRWGHSTDRLLGSS